MEGIDPIPIDVEVVECPFRSIGTEGFAAVSLSIVAVQAAISFSSHRWGNMARLFASLAAFPVAGSAIAVFLGYEGLW